MLIERDVPLETLTNIGEHLTKDGGSIVLISGEAGIGKTTVMQSFLESVKQDFIVRWGSCDPLDTPRVLGPIHDMYMNFGPKVQKALDDEASFSKLVNCIVEDLQGTAKPNLFVIEDAHWADNATLDLLKCVGRRVSFFKTMVLISYRSDEVSKSHPLSQAIGDFPQSRLTRLPLSPISRQGVELLATAAGKNAAGLHEATSGNPFYLTEFLANQSVENSEVPASIQDAVGARLNRLDATLQNFLETISVIPHAIESSLIDKLFTDRGVELLNSCVEKNFLRKDNAESFRFRHEIARLGTLARLPEHKQRSIHEEIYTHLKSTPESSSIDQLLFHATAAKLAEATLELAISAAENASRTGSHAEAASHYATALEYVHLAPDEKKATLYERWSYEAALVEINQQTIDARYKALEIWRSLDKPEKIGENLRWLSRLHWYIGESKKARGYITEAIQVLESADPSQERAMAYSLNSQYHMLNDHMHEAIEFGEKALELEGSYPNPEVRAHALTNVGTAMMIRDDRKGLEYLNEALGIALEHDLHEHAARVYTNTASSTVCGLDYEMAEKAVSDGIVFDTKHDLDSWTHYLIGIMSQLRMEQSRFEEAETIAAGVMALKNQTLLMKLPSLLVLSRVSLRLGRHGQKELLEKALSDACSVGETQYICPARVSLIEAAWHEDDDDEIHKQLKEIIAINTIPGYSWRGCEVAIWMHRYGYEVPDRNDPRMPLPYRLELDGDLMAAGQAWIDKGNPYRGALALMQADGEDALQHFVKAKDLLESCLATATLKKLGKLATAHGVDGKLIVNKRGPRKEARQHPLGLTAKEQQILPLIVDGLSNREISLEFSRSTRTVENHVASILKKMNVKNRMEAMLRGKNEPWLLDEHSVDRTQIHDTPTSGETRAC